MATQCLISHPSPQAMPSEVLCSQLTRMSEALQQAVRIIAQQEIETELMANAKKASQEYIGHFRGDHRQMSQRKNLVESRKEFIENTNKAKVCVCAHLKIVVCVFYGNDELFRSPFIQLSSCVLTGLFATDATTLL